MRLFEEHRYVGTNVWSFVSVRVNVCWNRMGEKSGMNQRGRVNFPGGRKSSLVSWYFEPSQLQTIISGLRTNFNLSPSYSAHRSLTTNFNKNLPKQHQHKVTQNKPYTYKHQTHFRRISSFGIAPVDKKKKKHVRLGHVGIVHNAVDLLLPNFKNVFLKRGRNLQKQ